MHVPPLSSIAGMFSVFIKNSFPHSHPPPPNHGKPVWARFAPPWRKFFIHHLLALAAAARVQAPQPLSPADNELSTGETCRGCSSLRCRSRTCTGSRRRCYSSRKYSTSSRGCRHRRNCHPNCRSHPARPKSRTGQYRCHRYSNRSLTSTT